VPVTRPGRTSLERKTGLGFQILSRQKVISAQFERASIAYPKCAFQSSRKLRLRVLQVISVTRHYPNKIRSRRSVNPPDHPLLNPESRSCPGALVSGSGGQALLIRCRSVSEGARYVEKASSLARWLMLFSLIGEISRRLDHCYLASRLSAGSVAARPRESSENSKADRPNAAGCCEDHWHAYEQ
jgi:hypothetical protein